MREVAPDVAILTTLISNAYLVGNAACWALVDACAPGNERWIRRAAERRFGRGNRPQAILLTHGHFDHAGSAGPLSDEWQVPIYAPPLELPFLTGQAYYPRFDLSSRGFFTRIARFFPTSTVNLGARTLSLETDSPIPGLSDWKVIETPGHTPGHVSFFRRRDGVLLAGDALTTMDLNSFIGTVARVRRVCGPPAPATSNWKAARRSIALLATLRPSCIAAGHGLPIRDAADELCRLASSAL